MSSSPPACDENERIARKQRDNSPIALPALRESMHGRFCGASITVTDRLIVDIGADGRMIMTMRLQDAAPTQIPVPGNLVSPLDNVALDSLRWYLEDYLSAPFGVYGERGRAVARALPAWGEALFGALFGSRPAREAYARWRARPYDVELVLRSDSADVLGLPWELLREPSRPMPLALDVLGVTRSLRTGRLDAPLDVSGERLRVLMVISRPRGGADVKYRMIGRRLLDRLEAFPGRVELVVLRPPTMEALAVALAEAKTGGEPFHVVHFDGHGAFGDGEGVLVFEHPRAGAAPVPGSSFAKAVQAGGVPLVVLNACQSGAIGRQVGASVSTRLLQEGIASVVAMAFSVYAVAAAEFMASFYGRLFCGDGVTTAVRAGRRSMYEHDRRPSPKGRLALADWLVPVHYRNRDVRFPLLRAARSGAPAGMSTTASKADELEGERCFVGRDREFFDLESCLLRERLVVLHGPAGTGKSELAKAFGRWWRGSGGVERPNGVIVHAFKPEAASPGLDGMVATIGGQLFGTGFALLPSGERRPGALGLLATQRCLLILDSFENVGSSADPVGLSPPLDDGERHELRSFLECVVDSGSSAVLITSRTDERWLGGARRIALAGLRSDDADAYADELLADYPSAAPRRATAAFAELLDWLQGNPLSMRLVLPHLASTAPEALLAALRGAGTQPAAPAGDQRALTAAIGYAFDQLGCRQRRLLMSMCVTSGVVEVELLAVLSRAQGAPERFGGFTTEAWREAFADAAELGLLTGLGGGFYRPHPALPSYAAARWRTEAGDDYERERAATAEALLLPYAWFADGLRTEMRNGRLASKASFLIGAQRHMLGELLGFALDRGLWGEATLLAPVLVEYLERDGLIVEADAWIRRVLAAVGASGAPPTPRAGGWALWRYATGQRCDRQIARREFDDAERTYLELREQVHADERVAEEVALIDFQLARIAHNAGRLKQAEARYSLSIAASERAGHESGIAAGCHQLASLLVERGRAEDAATLYEKSLAISSKLGDRTMMASTHHNLGQIALDRGQLEAAEAHYVEALAMHETIDDRAGMASCYHMLGMVTHERGRFGDAEGWYRRGLVIREQMGNHRGIVDSYLQLGGVARDRSHFDDARDWYTRAAFIGESHGDIPKAATAYRALGALAQREDRFDDARRWFLKALALTEHSAGPAVVPPPPSGRA